MHACDNYVLASYGHQDDDTAACQVPVACCVSSSISALPHAYVVDHNIPCRSVHAWLPTHSLPRCFCLLLLHPPLPLSSSKEENVIPLTATPFHQPSSHPPLPLDRSRHLPSSITHCQIKRALWRLSSAVAFFALPSCRPCASAPPLPRQVTTTIGEGRLPCWSL
jgi:hypothetical protein